MEACATECTTRPKKACGLRSSPPSKRRSRRGSGSGPKSLSPASMTMTSPRWKSRSSPTSTAASGGSARPHPWPSPPRGHVGRAHWLRRGCRMGRRAADAPPRGARVGPGGAQLGGGTEVGTRVRPPEPTRNAGRQGGGWPRAVCDDRARPHPVRSARDSCRYTAAPTDRRPGPRTAWP